MGCSRSMSTNPVTTTAGNLATSKTLLDYPEPTYPTDFKSWNRTSLERIATDAVIENRQLRSDLRAALDAYRQLVAKTYAAPDAPTV